MRISSIRFRPRLTIRALMVVVALVALGFGGWNAKVRWSICMHNAMMSAKSKDVARLGSKAAEELAKISEETVDGLERLHELPDFESQMKDLEELERASAAVSLPEEQLASIRTMKADLIARKESIARDARNFEKNVMQERADVLRYRREAIREAGRAEKLVDLERRYRRAAWRPWIDRRSIDRDLDAFFREDQLGREASAKESVTPPVLSDSSGAVPESGR